MLEGHSLQKRNIEDVKISERPDSLIFLSDRHQPQPKFPVAHND